ncbi:hypothetical protein LCGC14_0337820 [marine sediment metagenome]|uniref:Uncharacterized protein n=1 Tax=marine sediment metagenome TaxID=412755 RepID=A0A0F9WLX0_9ZZZZ
MSDYHVLGVSDNGQVVQVVFHIVVPSGNNFVGKAYSQAIVEDDSVSKISVVPGLGTSNPTEVTALAAGTLVERSFSFKVDAGLSNAAKRDRLDVEFREMEAQVRAAIPRKYNFWGFERTVP